MLLANGAWRLGPLFFDLSRICFFASTLLFINEIYKTKAKYSDSTEYPGALRVRQWPLILGRLKAHGFKAPLRGRA